MILWFAGKFLPKKSKVPSPLVRAYQYRLVSYTPKTNRQNPTSFRKRLGNMNLYPPFNDRYCHERLFAVC